MSEVGKKKIFDQRYEILSIVGRGKCSVVYHARHVSGSQSDVALKVLLNRKGQSNAELLRKEALAMVSARHKYVVRLDDFHSIGELAYLSMEYAPKSDLRRYIKSIGGKVGPVQGQLFLIQTAEALNFMHQAGLIHRDVKPDNILVVSDREIRLADFGVAVLPGENSSIEELQKGVGTMNYMAPEVLDGTRYDQRSDVYALGVTFYELLSGKHPFQDAPLMQQLAVRKDGAFPHLKKLEPSIPEHLADSIMQSLAFDPADRLSSARELVQNLLIQNQPKSRRSEILTQNKPQENSPTPASKKAAETPAPSDPQVEMPPARSKNSDKENQIGRQKSTQSVAKESKAESKPSPAQAAIKAILAEPQSTSRPERTAQKKPAATADSSKLASKTTVRNDSSNAAMDMLNSSEKLESNSKEQIQKQPIKPPRGLHTVKRRKNSPTGVDDSRMSREKTSQVKNSGLERLDPNRSETLQITREQMEHAISAGQTPATSASNPTQDPVIDLERQERRRSAFPGWFFWLVFLGLIYYFYPVLGINLSSDDPQEIQSETTEENLVVSGSPIPEYHGNQLEFPNLPAGMYAGTITGLIPGREIPLSMIALPDQKQVAVIIGLEGWTPQVIETTPQTVGKLRLKSNGFVLDMTAENVDGELYGLFRDVVSGNQGEWKLSPTT